MCAQTVTSDDIARLSGWRRWRAQLLALLPGATQSGNADASEDGEDRHGSAGLGALLSFAVRIGSAGITFLAQILMARWLGAHDFGVYTYVWVVVNVTGTLSTIGLSVSAVRFLNEYLEHGQPGLARGFLRFGRFASFGVGIVAMLLGEVLLYLFPHLIEDVYRGPLMIGLLALPAFALTDFHDGTGRARSWLLLALAPPYILRPLALLVFIGAGIVLLSYCNAKMAAAALVAATWLVALVQFVLQERRFRGELGSVRREMRRLEWLRVSLPLLLLDSFTLMMMNIDVLLLKLFVSPDQLAIYFAAARVISFVAFVHFAVTAVATPRFATAYARNDITMAGRLLRQFRLWTFAPSLAAALFLLALGPFVLSLFGPEFPAAMPVMAVLAVGHLARALAGPAEAMMAVSGRQVYSAVVTGVTAGLNVVLNLALIPQHGLLGAAMATAGAYVFQSAILWAGSHRVLREGFGKTANSGEKLHAASEA